MRWKYPLVLGALTCVFAACSPNERKENVSAQEEAAAKSHATAYTAAFNAQDLDKLLALWAPDAAYVNFSTHQQLQGKDAIATFFKEQFQEQGNTKLHVTLDKLTSQNSQTLQERGTAITVSNDGTENKTVFLADLKKIDGQWLLQKVFEAEAQEPHSNYEQLKELEWLVGKWEDKADYLDFSLAVNWAENRNFLEQKFVLQLLNQKDFNGKQLIGWDPSRKQIRSWMIDEDGGFGEGFWSKQGDHWYAAMAFTLPDGRKASATHVYTKINDRTFTFASQNRDIDGKILPDIQPIQIVKTP